MSGAVGSSVTAGIPLFGFVRRIEVAALVPVYSTFLAIEVLPVAISVILAVSWEKCF